MLNKEFQEICVKIEELMINALKNSAHSFRTFSLASIDDKMPSLRTVVLRDFSIDNRFLDCHSDLRSPKVEELKKNNKFSALFYSTESQPTQNHKMIYTEKTQLIRAMKNIP